MAHYLMKLIQSIKWGQKRFWWMVAPTVILSVIGPGAVEFATMLGPFQEEIKTVAKTAISAEAAGETTAQIRSEAGNYRKRIGQLQSQAKTVYERLRNLRQEIENEMANAKILGEKDIAALTSRFVRMEKLAKEFARLSAKTRSLLVRLEKEQKRLAKKSKTVKKDPPQKSTYWVLSVVIGVSQSATPARSKERRNSIHEILAGKGYKGGFGWQNERSHFKGGYPRGTIVVFYANGLREKADGISEILKKNFPGKKLETRPSGFKLPADEKALEKIRESSFDFCAGFHFCVATGTEPD